MSSIEKLREQFYNDPVPKTIVMDDVKRLARYYGCKVLTGGNHQIRIANPKNGMVVPLPQHGKEVHPQYVKELRELFDDKEMKK